MDADAISDYFRSLDPPARKRYEEKIKFIDNLDPYIIDNKNFTYDIKDFPTISYPDIVNYLVFGTSPFSAEDMKAYKSLEAYNQVLEGWVIDVKALTTSTVSLVKGKVRISALRV